MAQINHGDAWRITREFCERFDTRKAREHYIDRQSLLDKWSAVGGTATNPEVLEQMIQDDETQILLLNPHEDPSDLSEQTRTLIAGLRDPEVKPLYDWEILDIDTPSIIEVDTTDSGKIQIMQGAKLLFCRPRQQRVWEMDIAPQAVTETVAAYERDELPEGMELHVGLDASAKVIELLENLDNGVLKRERSHRTAARIGAITNIEYTNEHEKIDKLRLVRIPAEANQNGWGNWMSNFTEMKTEDMVITEFTREGGQIDYYVVYVLKDPSK